MSTVAPPVPTATQPAVPSATEWGNPAPRVLARIAGGALPLGVAAFAGGILTSPIADGDDRAAYLGSLARDPGLTQLSAVLLHDGNLLLGVGALALPLLVCGRKAGCHR